MDNLPKNLRIGVNLRMFEEKPSGIQNYIFGLFKALVKKDKTNKYFFFTTGDKKIEETASYIKADSWFIKILKRLDIRLSNIFFDNLYVLKLIKRFKVDIFISPSSILPILKPKGVKYLVVVHDLSFLQYPHNPLKIYMNLVMYMKTVMPFVLKRADSIVVDSFFVKKQLEKVYRADPKKIKVIYLGRDNFFSPEKDEAVFLKLVKKYRVQKKFIFTTATNHERKNIFGLINAFKKISQFDDYQLIICGLLPDFTIATLKEFIKNNYLTNKVKFLGFVSKEELRTLYSNAKLFVFPSFEEGFGLPVLEAAQCHCLPICSNAGALPEVIGNKNLLFNPRDIDSISAKIDEVLKMNQLERDAQLSIVEEHIRLFNWRKTVDEWLSLLDNLKK